MTWFIKQNQHTAMPFLNMYFVFERCDFRKLLAQLEMTRFPGGACSDQRLWDSNERLCFRKTV